MTDTCPICGAPFAHLDDVLSGCARYADSQGGHADRHTLIVEEAGRIIATSSSARPADG